MCLKLPCAAAPSDQIYTVCARLELRECDAGGPPVRLLLCEVRRASGLDVREAGVGLAAAGRGAQVPRATALWERNDKKAWMWGVKAPTLGSGATRWKGQGGLPELVSDWQDLDFPMRDMRLAAAIVPSLDVLKLRTSLQERRTLMHDCCQNVCFYSL